MKYDKVIKQAEGLEYKIDTSCSSILQLNCPELGCAVTISGWREGYIEIYNSHKIPDKLLSMFIALANTPIDERGELGEGRRVNSPEIA